MPAFQIIQSTGGCPTVLNRNLNFKFDGKTYSRIIVRNKIPIETKQSQILNFNKDFHSIRKSIVQYIEEELPFDCVHSICVFFLLLIKLYCFPSSYRHKRKMPNFWPCKSLPKRNGHLDTSGVSTGGHSVAYEDPDAHLHHHPLVRHHNMEVNWAENKYNPKKYIVSLYLRNEIAQWISNYINSCHRKVIEIDEALFPPKILLIE